MVLDVAHLPFVERCDNDENAWITWAFRWAKGVNVNHMYRTRYERGTRLPTEGRVLRAPVAAWQQVVIDCVSLSLKRHKLFPPPYALTLWLVPPRGMRYDADGLIKVVQDGIAKGAGFDDQEIVSVTAHKCEPERKRARVVARLRWDTMDVAPGLYPL